MPSKITFEPRLPASVVAVSGKRFWGSRDKSPRAAPAAIGLIGQSGQHMDGTQKNVDGTQAVNEAKRMGPAQRAPMGPAPHAGGHRILGTQFRRLTAGSHAIASPRRVAI